MKTEDIISMISDLPLQVQLKLRRKSNEYLLSSSDSLNHNYENFVNTILINSNAKRNLKNNLIFFAF